MGEFGEAVPPLHGEDIQGFILPSSPLLKTPIVKERKLTLDEASKCLSMLGKDESGIRYSYLNLTATDMKLTDISVVLNFRHILFLDVSNNYLTLDNLQVVAKMPFLLLLKADKNRLDSGDLDPMPYLQVLTLNSNQISETCDICQPMLESLELHYNPIYLAQFDPEKLSRLKQLEMRGNQLMDISGRYPTSVEKLYLPMNRIRSIKTLSFADLKKLKLLHLRDNNLKKLDGFTDAQSELIYINLRNNKINKLRQFRKLKCCVNLETLIILGNPVQGEEVKAKDEEEELEGEEGEMKPSDVNVVDLLVLLPQLKRINKHIVTLEDREAAQMTKDEVLAKIMAEESSDEEEELATTTDITTDYTTEVETDRQPDMNEEEGK